MANSLAQGCSRCCTMATGAHYYKLINNSERPELMPIPCPGTPRRPPPPMPHIMSFPAQAACCAAAARPSSGSLPSCEHLRHPHDIALCLQAGAHQHRPMDGGRRARPDPAGPGGHGAHLQGGRGRGLGEVGAAVWACVGAQCLGGGATRSCSMNASHCCSSCWAGSRHAAAEVTCNREGGGGRGAAGPAAAAPCHPTARWPHHRLHALRRHSSATTFHS